VKEKEIIAGFKSQARWWREALSAMVSANSEYPAHALYWKNRIQDLNRIESLVRDRDQELAQISTAAARAVLLPGDKLYVERCGGIKSTVKFLRWDKDWIVTPTLSDVHARHIIKVNGKPHRF